MPSLRLTNQRGLNFFDTFGYLGFPGLMADRIDQIIMDFEASWEAKGGGHNGQKHDGTARSCIAPFIDRQKRLHDLCWTIPVSTALPSSLLSQFLISTFMGSDGEAIMSEISPWHSDGSAS